MRLVLDSGTKDMVLQATPNDERSSLPLSKCHWAFHADQEGILNGTAGRHVAAASSRRCLQSGKMSLQQGDVN